MLSVTKKERKKERKKDYIDVDDDDFLTQKIVKWSQRNLDKTGQRSQSSCSYFSFLSKINLELRFLWNESKMA